MKDTFFYVPQDKVDRLATAYTLYEGKSLARFPAGAITEGPFSYSADYPVAGPKKLFSGGGGLCSTASDYARFCQLMLNKGYSLTWQNRAHLAECIGSQLRELSRYLRMGDEGTRIIQRLLDSCTK